MPTPTLPPLSARIVTPRGTVDGWLEVDGDRIGRIAEDDAPAGAVRRPRHIVVPGFVDLHHHGGGGHSVTAGDPNAVIGAVRFHRDHGTTTALASLVTARVDDLTDASRRIAALLSDGSDAAPDDVRALLAGIHLEGPFLATARCGAQDPVHMIDPTADIVDELLAAGGGWLRSVTVAPERSGATAAITRLVDHGVVAAIGHTDASTLDCEAAVAAGATLATHLGNAMRPLHHREPGPIGTCLTAPSVVCELIVDGHHLHEAMVRLASRAKGDDGIALITDAISASGAGDGEYELGGHRVEVRNGVARLHAGDALAGSTLTMKAAFRNAVGAGLSLDQAARAASTNPARVLGLSGDRGSVAVGQRADLVVLDEHLDLVAVVASGRLVAGSVD